jgi:hypothetical protein
MARAKTRSSKTSRTRGKSTGSSRGGRKTSASAARGSAAQSRGQSRGKARGQSRGQSRGKSSSTRGRASAARGDAITLLKDDHRKVEEMFSQFENARGDDRKRNLAEKICMALRVHSSIEEEIFYPAFLEATRDQDLHHEAIIEHDGAKKLIAEIESSGPDNDYFDARVSVLAEMIRHHVHEEERRDGMFAQAKSAGMDLRGLGEQLAARKAQLEAEPEPMKRAKQLKDAGKGLMTRLASVV